MVESTALEMRQTGNGLESSNLSLSAKNKEPDAQAFGDYVFRRGRDSKASEKGSREHAGTSERGQVEFWSDGDKTSA